MEPSPLYLTKAHSCIAFDVKKRMLENAIRAGQVRAFRIGRKILIEKASIETWIQSCEITPTDRQIVKSELQQLMDRAIAHAKKKTCPPAGGVPPSRDKMAVCTQAPGRSSPDEARR
jgi:hypothetical protein